MEDFDGVCEYSGLSWDWKSLGFENQHEFNLWRYFNNKSNPCYYGEQSDHISDNYEV